MIKVISEKAHYKDTRGSKSAYLKSWILCFHTPYKLSNPTEIVH